VKRLSICAAILAATVLQRLGAADESTLSMLPDLHLLEPA
jgi:hypothetical protein